MPKEIFQKVSLEKIQGLIVHYHYRLFVVIIH